MKNIVWKNYGNNAGFPCYQSKIGFVEAFCTPKIVYPYGYYDRRRLIGWSHRIWCKGKSINGIKIRKSLEKAKNDAENLARKCLLGFGSEIITGLKMSGMLEKVLDEVGIDL
jgi:hypothetical protein